MPTEPPASPWRFPPAGDADEHGLVGIGADLEPGTILAAYRHGLFPMPVDRGRTLGWWSPDPRGIIPLEGLRVTRSLRRSCHRFEVTVDTAFAEVIRACGDPDRPHGWLTPAMIEAYTRLHDLGWAHSVEARTPEGELAGGLYGIAIGGLFAGESMFHRRRDASKVALVHLVTLLRDGGAGLLDVQWQTGHLASLGGVEVSRERYLDLLADALDQPLPSVFAP
jgi:leucyl/phenylalanyl-tRNA--protein transferase